MNTFYKKLKEKIRIYSNQQYLDGYIKREFLTDDGTAEIFLNIDKKDDLFDSYAVGVQTDLRKEIYEFIEEKSAMLGNQVPIRLNITGFNFNSHEQEMIKHILKEHFAIELYKIQQDYTNHRKKIFFLVCIGLLSFLMYILFSYITNSEFLLLIFSFISSFSIWEAMDSIIYTFSEIKYNREAITQNLLMNIEFVEKK